MTGVLANGSGPTVLLRCELDALPLRETTGAPFASTVTVKDAQGQEVSVDHACGHDMHMACMTTMATLMAARRDQWNGTLITLFQPAEETGEGAQEMVDDGLFTRIPVPDVALAQAFAAHFGDLAGEIPRQTVSEDFSKIPDAAHVPYCYWAIGFTDKQAYLAAEKAGTLDDLPTNHSPAFLPPLQPTLRTGTEALVAGALAWLAPH